MGSSMSTAYVLLLLIDDPDRSVCSQKISDPVPRQRAHRPLPRLQLSLVLPKYLWWSGGEKSNSGSVHDDDHIWKAHHVRLCRLVYSLLGNHWLNHRDAESKVASTN